MTRLCLPCTRPRVLQSGRSPYHVNPLNAAMEIHNEVNDPVSGFAGVPRNMTGMATKLASVGYVTHQVGCALAPPLQCRQEAAPVLGIP